MNKAFSSLFQVSFFTCCSLIANNPVTAQSISSDGTLPTPTEVTPTATGVEINGGTTRGGNLFHSFKDFSVPTGSEAFFNNASDVVNILNRVTGGSISSIDGLLRANGSANLFLINPAGIVFGEGARLDIGGSFYGSTANSILFPDGVEFSATDTQAQPILTINAPIGLSFRDNPGDIVNNSTANDGNGLEVSPGNNITLLGGDVKFNSGNLTAPGGIVNLGGLATEGTINFADDGSLTFPEGVVRGDVSLTNTSEVSVLSSGGGSIFVNANNLELNTGSSFIAGIGEGLGSDEAQAGNIVINANDSVSLDDSDIFNQVEIDGIGNSGDIEINSAILNLASESRISTSTLGQGSAGNVNINTNNSINVSESSDIYAIVFDSGIGNAGEINLITSELNLTGSNSLISASTLGQGDAGKININASDSVVVSEGSAIFTIVTESGVGNGGNINIDTTNLSISDGSLISSTTLGKGNAGNISIQTENINISNNSDFLTGIFAFVGTDAIGKAGQIDINTNNLNISNGVAKNSFISVSTGGKGDAGVINVMATESINLFNNANIWAVVFESAMGDAGSVNIQASSLEFDDFSKVSVESFGQGNSGNLVIDADLISLFDGSQIIGSIEGTGEGGNLIVNAETIEIVDSFESGGFIRPTGILSNINQGGEGNAGEINITAKNIRLNGFRAEISASVFGKGNAGNTSVTAMESIDITKSSGIYADIFNTDATGNGGNLTINTPNLSLSNMGEISVENRGQGNAGILSINANLLSILSGSRITGDVSGIGDGGDIFINAKSIQIDDLVSQTGTSSSTGIFTGVGFEASGDAGNITIITDELKLTGFNSKISSSLDSGTSSGNGGILNINASKFISIEGTSFASSDNTGIFASVLEDEATGNSGSVNINTPLLLLDDGTISVNNQGQGNGGDLLINADSIDLKNNSQLIAETFSRGGASIVLNVSGDITLQNNSFISARALNDANGGNLTIDTNFIVAYPNGNNDIIASAERGSGGNINITAEALFGIEERSLNDLTNDINASSEVFGLEGNVTINTPDVDPFQETSEAPENVVEPDQVVAGVCDATQTAQDILADRENTFVINGRGGVPPTPIEPMPSETVIIEGESVPLYTETEERALQEQYPAIMTDRGAIYPARGILKNPDGTVILTRYPTDNTQRVLNNSSNCGV